MQAAIAFALEDDDLVGHAVAAVRLAKMADLGIQKKVQQILNATDKTWIRREATKYLKKYGNVDR